ncbi:MAG: response regulator [Oscillospiraceae bacterium]|nr:response regulator [Oscillospiraceae bacterium]
MINRERLYAIAELAVSEGLDKLSDSLLGMYIDSVNSFIDHFPIQSQKLQDAVDDQDSASVISGIYVPLCDTLIRLYASGLVSEYRPKFDKLISEPDIDYDALEAVVENFIQAVSALSIDIQMAIRPNAPPAHRRYFPPVANATPDTGNKPKAKQSDNKTPKKILAVDNAIMYLNTLTKMLANTSYELYTTTSCSEALDFIKNENPALLLLDIEMPEMNGYELARKIKDSGCDAPIIFITANSARSYVDKAIEVGAEALLMKPLRSNQLLSKISEFI